MPINIALNPIESNRIQGFEYTSGWFFITICTKDREHYFGKIIDGKMMVNDIGKIVNQCRSEIPNHFPNARIDEFVVMPNHIHGIVIVGENNVDEKNDRDGNKNDFVFVKNDRNGNKNDRDVALQRLYGQNKIIYKYDGQKYSYISPKKGMLGTIIRSYKSACTYIINKLPIGPFHRQSNYYDHIIRNEKSLYVIRFYIKNNPNNWNEEKNRYQNLYI